LNGRFPSLLPSQIRYLHRPRFGGGRLAIQPAAPQKTTALRRRRPHVRIVSGAPLANKTGHSGRSCAAAHHKVRQNRLAADNVDFRVVHLDLVDHRADVRAPEWRLARQNVPTHELDERRYFVLGDPRLAGRSVSARSKAARAISRSVFTAATGSLRVASAVSAMPFSMAV